MKPTTLQQKAAALLHLDQRRKAHHRALSSLHASPLASQEEHEQRGLRMWRRLRRIEAIAHDATTAQCNGERYGSQPYREDDESGESPLDVFFDGIRSDVAKVFGGTLPTGFMINHDTRGYALKLDSDKTTIPHGLETDWGGYGILAADITM